MNIHKERKVKFAMYKLRPCLVLKMEITIGMTIINSLILGMKDVVIE